MFESWVRGVDSVSVYKSSLIWHVFIISMRSVTYFQTKMPHPDCSYKRMKTKCLFRLVFLKVSKATICSGEEKDHRVEITLLSEEWRGIAGF